jgi:parallel beta-helix repeat protein
MSIRAHVKLVATAASAAALAVAFAALTSAGAGASEPTRTYPSSTCPQADGPAGGLEQCIASAPPGATIIVKPGVYYENDIDVTKKITIVGPGPAPPCPSSGEESESSSSTSSRAVFDAAPPRPPAVGIKGVGFDVQANDVTIGCLTIRHARTAIDADQVAPVNNLRLDRLRTINAGDGTVPDVDIRGDGFRVENSVFFGGNDNALETDGDNGRVLNNRARLYGNACFELNGNTMLVDGNSAMICEDNDGFTVIGDDNTIRRNTASIADSEGFEIRGANPVVEYNKATGGFGNDGFTVLCFTTCHKGRVVGNSAQGSNDDDQGFEILISPGVTFCSTVPFPCFRVSGNTSSMNTGEGFRLTLSGSLISGNAATLNGTEDEEGFEVRGNDNVIEANILKENAFDGLTVNGNGNTIRRNSASLNGVDGIHLQNGASNRLDRNTALYNEGDGIENDGAATTITGNVSKGNRRDCVGDLPPATSSGNSCADGSDFVGDPGTIDEF